MIEMIMICWWNNHFHVLHEVTFSLQDVGAVQYDNEIDHPVT